MDCGLGERGDPLCLELIVEPREELLAAGEVGVAVGTPIIVAVVGGGSNVKGFTARFDTGLGFPNGRGLTPACPRRKA